MANRKPLVLVDGQMQQLKSGDAVAASDISFDSTSTQISATNVQAALAEIDNDLITFALALS